MQPTIITPWGQSRNSDALLTDAKSCAQLMDTLSCLSPYKQSLAQYQQFCVESLNAFDVHGAPSSPFFKAFFLYLNPKKNHSEIPVIGFLNVHILDDVAEIDFICVESNQRKSGVASALLGAFERKFSGKIGLEVGVNNIEATSFYKKHGFSMISTRKNYYKNSEDALYMQK